MDLFVNLILFVAVVPGLGNYSYIVDIIDSLNVVLKFHFKSPLVEHLDRGLVTNFVFLLKYHV